MKEKLNVKNIIDRILVIDFFLVLFGAIYFLLSVICYFFGVNIFLNIFQLLWLGFFTPTISILILASIINAIWDWLLNRERPLN